jgi:OOP family OmpA-OmpF porin
VSGAAYPEIYMTHTERKYSPVAGKLSLLVLALMAAPYALAAEPGWYLGANIGQSQATIDTDRIRGGLLGSGLSAGPIDENDRDGGYKLFGGYQLNRHFAVEGGYFDLGQFGFSTTTTPTGKLNGDIKLKGINLDLVGTLPISERFSAFGRIGVARSQASDTFTGTGAVTVLNPNPSARSNNLKVGLGLDYAFAPALSVRTEIERYRVDDALGNKGDVDLISVGLVYRFGGKTPAPVARQAPPEPVVVAQAPPPVVVVPAPPPPPPPAPPPPPPPPPPVPQRVSFAADSLFDFNKSVVKPAGQTDLDKLANDLRGVDYEVITVIGHTDRIGSQAYNQKLSTRRAEAVSAYLMQAGGIPANKISAKGVGRSDPVTKPGDCKGTKKTPTLIACLQPDRRVDIEVTGKR